jgi:uncharacterized protein
MDNMLVLAGISVFVGFLGSLIGLGGAAILIPLLVLFGIPVKEAIASAIVVIIATSSGAASSYVRDRIVNIKLAMFLEMFTVTGAIAGATITTLIAPVYLYFFFAAFLMTSFLRIKASKKDNFITQNSFSQWLGLNGSYYDVAHQKRITYQVNRPLIGGMGMLIAGLAAGMLGIGAGAFKVTVMENVLHIPTKVASTTSNFVIGMTALAGLSVYLFSGLLNLTLMVPMAIGATIGAFIGGKILNRVKESLLRLLFFVIVIFLIIQMIYKGIGAL